MLQCKNHAASRREHSEHWLQRFDYQEAGPQLLMQALLQRLVNGGGRVEREYGLGRDRTDLPVIWRYPGGVQKIALELKIWRKTSGAHPRRGAGADRAVSRSGGRRHQPSGDLRPERPPLGGKNLPPRGNPSGHLMAQAMENAAESANGSTTRSTFGGRYFRIVAAKLLLLP